MILRDLIGTLEAMPQDRRVKRGLMNPHSYRGIYEDLAFEISGPMTIGQITAVVKSTRGVTFEGYKGGDYEMGEWAQVWIAEYGSGGGETLGPTLLGFLLDDEETT